MNKANLKSYAPQARKDFITAVTARASLLGITAEHVSPATVSGGVAIIDGMEWPAKVAAQRQALLDRIARHSGQTPQGAQHTINPAAFQQTMEEVAYTWFNRLVALRYMEIHELLDHGHRVLSSRDGGLPELLRHAAEVSLPGLQAARVQELQLAGNQDNALYKLLLVAQCNELSRTMPFLFERIDDDTELLLPDNLLRTDSIIAKLVAGVPEDDWEEIEAIGWLYQFYISEKKGQVIGKVVKSEDIPAATQLFTPNWIVQYLVQNSVGRLWLMANPQSTLASEWPYYIPPAEQTPEVQAQLDALIQTRVREDGDTLNPETITVLDPACGSGHILVVAYDVLKAIYLERGYRLRDIPRLILEKNLYGLDIDDRAAQLAGFALLMKARADDRRLLADPANPPKLNVLSLQESKALNVDDAATHLAPFGVQRATVRALADAFEHAKTLARSSRFPTP
ncbi:MAG: BREX-1 system adenine-specific DNA-methyltransferase PglX [Hydrogenophaga sp.]|uniref:BREX-1 system adenine-specific DNA-methyltransferase PglX n=1 Tax=Hydrogenophaga sp. TaxID=1904254 RepID=UPI002ABA0B53|nr:BREX-1 system adenine-specific DNA-methyltransferase PglX [Hydrogenophaga sp.]MDZ4187960.1 BREX-1 system adenine-specific DNA-methyltransferase PglX [Hydrogenophaga sp.]